MNSSSTEPEFTARDGRRFGVQVGLAFLALGALLVWRDHLVAAGVMGGLAALLLGGGLVRPAALGPVYRRWMAVAHAISKVTNPIFLAIVYFLVLTPTGVVMRALGRNPIVHEPGEDGSYWIRRDPDRGGDMRRQF